MEKMYRDFTLCENCGERCYLGNKLCEDCANDEVDRWVTHKQVDCNTIQEQSDLIEDLKVKLAESEKDRLMWQEMYKSADKQNKEICETDIYPLQEQVQQLKQQLEEKDLAIENWEAMYKSVVQTCHNDAKEISRLREQLEKKDDEILKGDCAFVKEVYNSEQDKISFAVEQLEKVKELVEEKSTTQSPFGTQKIYASDVSAIIDNQIKAIKEME